MASLTIRNLDDGLKERLRVRAAQHGRSMEEEARTILAQVVVAPTLAEIYARSRELFSGENGVELILPPRTSARPLPDFSGPESDEL